MADAATTLIQQARAAGIIDERAAETMLRLHRGAQTGDLADAPEAVRQATDLSAEASAKAERFGKFVLVEKIGEGGMPGSMKAGPSCGGGRLRRLAVRVGGQISS